MEVVVVLEKGDDTDCVEHLVNLIVETEQFDMRLGTAVAIARKLGFPIRFIGLGEQAGDFGPFDAAAFAAALVDGSELEGGQ